MLRRTFGLVLCLIAPNVGQAGFEFGFTGGTYTAGQIGSTVTETLYLRATGGDTLANLQAFAFQMVAGPGGTTIVPTLPATPQSFQPAAGWNIGAGGGDVAGGIRLSYTAAAPIAAASNQVSLGQISFALGSNPTPITFSDFQTANPNTFGSGSFSGGGLAAMDTQIFGAGQSGTISQTIAVPEPGMVSLLAVFGCVAPFVRRRSAA